MQKIIAGLIFCGVIILSSTGVAGLLSWARHRKILDIPNERSSHSQPTPRVGGLPIITISLIGLMLYWLIYPKWPLKSILAYTLGASVIAVVSWLDDLKFVSVVKRLSAHSLGAVLVLVGFDFCGEVNSFFAGQPYVGWMALFLGFFGIVGLINAYNFMDGIDGIAGGQGLVAGLGWAIVGWLMDLPIISVLGALLAATCMGFLVHNLQPARVFMGDVGSTFLGYTFAVLPIAAAKSDPNLIFIGILLVWPFIFDSTFTFFRRLLKGDRVLTAHRSHLYQRLVISGYTHHSVTLIYTGLALTGLLMALVFLMGSELFKVLTILVAVTEAAALWFFVLWQERKFKNTHNPPFCS